jgi:hypothetical protein
MAAGLWIRIGSGVRDFVDNTDPDPGAFWGENLDEKHRYFLFDLTQILIYKKFEKEIVFECSVLAWIRIRIEQKCWIRIRIKSIRIHNPVWQTSLHGADGSGIRYRYGGIHSVVLLNGGIYWQLVPFYGGGIYGQVL